MTRNETSGVDGFIGGCTKVGEQCAMLYGGFLASIHSAADNNFIYGNNTFCCFYLFTIRRLILLSTLCLQEEIFRFDSAADNRHVRGWTSSSDNSRHKPADLHWHRTDCRTKREQRQQLDVGGWERLQLQKLG